MTDTDTTGREWLTPQELATELQLPLKTIYAWRHSGTGPRGHRIGKHLRFRRSDFEAWLAARADAA
jgi:excisionase family DNA binding protein